MSTATADIGKTGTGADLHPISMQEAVGYPAIDCSHQATVEDYLVLKNDRLFLLVTPHGDITPAGACGLGLFQDDTRVLSQYALRFAGTPPALLSSQAARMYSAQVDLAITDRDFGGHAWDPKNSIHIRRQLLLSDFLTERITLTSFLSHPVDFWMEMDVGCDFADIFEVRGWHRDERGQFFAPQCTDDSLIFAYRGRGGVLMESALCFAQPPTEVKKHGARWSFQLQPGQPMVLAWEVHASTAGKAPISRYTGGGEREKRAALEKEYDEWRAECTQWVSDVAEFDAALERSIVDLRALYIEADGHRVISAGIPWYSAVFGRDSIIASLQTLCLNPHIARDTLSVLARYQGTKEDAYTEEQPGRILHELRRGEMARSGEIPHTPYYGTVDATPLWLVLLHETWRWTGDDAMVRELLPHADRALKWIDDYGDLDGDGFVEYASTSSKGLVNQGWKDSADGVPFPDGSLPAPPIALVEVQGYVYDAKRRMSEIYDAFGQGDRADALRKEADELRRKIQERFWLDDLGTFALALDGKKEPLRTPTTNAGHLLWSRVPSDDQVKRLCEQLLSPAMFSGWGIRTLSAELPVYNPMSYHDGSVWPHDNSIVGLGLALMGHGRSALPILSALHDASVGLRYHRLPELYCGMKRASGNTPVLYPVSCSPQAWASGALFMLLQGVTGMRPDARKGVLHIRDPHLPQFLCDLTLIGVRVGESRVSLHFTRKRNRTVATLVEVEGPPLQVIIELS
ncbi:MAG TPA: glycogen debranching N-terminal domain-containing protein [Longimicrobiaceae bacterium]|nr:glycogen debranching N-terminal domain-containing protein [Longimicrobiaceae bacterium]